MDVEKTLKELGVVQVGGRFKAGKWQVDLLMYDENKAMSSRSGHGESFSEALTEACKDPEPPPQPELQKTKLKTGDRPAKHKKKGKKAATPKAVEVEEVEREDTERFDVNTLSKLRKESAGA